MSVDTKVPRDQQRDTPLILMPWSGRPVAFMVELVGALRWRYGWGVLSLSGGAGIDRVRSALASRAMQTQHTHWLWVDNDNVHTPERVVQLMTDARRLDLDFLAAVIPCRATETWANIGGADDLPGDITMGPGGGITEVGHAGLAMAVTHRRLFEAMASEMVEVDYPFGDEVIVGHPFFCPFVVGRSHLGEDVAFCVRARAMGRRLYADTSMIGLHETVYRLGAKDIQLHHERRVARYEAVGIGVD